VVKLHFSFDDDDFLYLVMQVPSTIDYKPQSHEVRNPPVSTRCFYPEYLSS
jgi:hypothetical protein